MFTILSGLFACVDGINVGDGTGDTSGNDTNDPTATALVTVDVTKLGVLEPCTVNFTDGDGNVTSGDSSSPIELTYGTYKVNAGDEVLDAWGYSVFGFPVHTDSDGATWAAKPLTLVVVNSDTSYALELFRVFEPRTYTCTRDDYEYDASAEDYRGEYYGDAPQDPQRVEMDENGVLIPEEDPGIATFPIQDYLYADGAILKLEDIRDYGDFVTDSAIGNSYFSFTMVAPEHGTFVSDTSCR